MRISDWSSDVCSSDLVGRTGYGPDPRAHDDPQCRLAAVRKPRTAVDTIRAAATTQERVFRRRHACLAAGQDRHRVLAQRLQHLARSEEHTSELQSLMRISYAVFCLKKKTHTKIQHAQYINK